MPARSAILSSRAWRAAAAAFVALSVLWSADPASAHAVLLRTEPSPQTTVARAPAAVRLHFSEPVEVALGAVRVYDVDGHRVDSTRLTRTDGGREVDVPARLSNGTYTVTWRVTSADGHPVHGGFTFYVGAPSTISAASVPAQHGAGRLVGWGYGVIRFLWFGALLAVVGLVVVRRWVWTPALRAAGATASPGARHFRRRLRRALAGAWVLLALAGAATVVFQAASVTGLPLGSAARPSVVRQVLHTAFGHLWIAQMALTAVAVVPVVGLVRRRRTLGLGPDAWIGLLGVTAAGLALVSALNGHARTLGRAGIDVPSVAVHLLAVAVWVGGLGAVVLLARPAWRRVAPEERTPVVRGVVARFGRVAMVALALVLVTGVVNALGELESVSDLWRVDHGRVVAAKIVLLAVALVFAARHRWAVPRRLAEPATAGAAVSSFGRTAGMEVAVLGGAVALAAGLVALVPGRSLALAARGPVNLERRAGSYTAQLFIDPTAVGANEVHVTFVTAQGLAAAEVSGADVTLARPAGPPAPVQMRLISPGHFVGDTTLPAPGRYRLSVMGRAGATTAATTFDFRLRATSRRR